MSDLIRREDTEDIYHYHSKVERVKEREQGELSKYLAFEIEFAVDVYLDTCMITK